MAARGIGGEAEVESLVKRTDEMPVFTLVDKSGAGGHLIVVSSERIAVDGAGEATVISGSYAGAGVDGAIFHERGHVVEYERGWSDFTVGEPAPRTGQPISLFHEVIYRRGRDDPRGVSDGGSRPAPDSGGDPCNPSEAVRRANAIFECMRDKELREKMERMGPLDPLVYPHDIPGTELPGPCDEVRNLQQ